MTSFALSSKTLVESLAELDDLGRRYSCRPSALAGETDPEWAYQIDSAARQAGIYADRRARQQVKQTPPPGPPPTMTTTTSGPLLTGTLRMAA